MKRTLIISCTALALLSGCAPQIPPLNFSVPNVEASRKQIPAELKAITVTLARPDEAKGDLPFGVEIAAPLWKESLEEALARMALFRDGANKSVTLSVKILGINYPSFGINFPTTAIARYELLDRSSGAIIYTETIESNAETPGDYSFVGAARQRESINRAIQNNISKFLMAVETVNVKKPLFRGR
jgi:hypothetical protein